MIYLNKSQYSKNGQILICGDLNARTGHNELDFIQNDDSSYIPLSEKYLQDTFLECRNSQDKHIDARGRDLLDFCIESQMRILNGRTFGDTQGMFTSYKYNGNSVVDYMMASENLLSQVLYFNVGLNRPRLSDHSKISCKIMANYSIQCKSSNLLPFPAKYKWTETSSESFKDALCSCAIKQKIKDFENLDASSSTEILVDKLENIIIATADFSLRKNVKKSSKNNKSSKKWYDTELYKMRRYLDQKGHLYAKYPSDPFIRGSYYKFRKLYVKSCKRKRKEYKGHVIEKLERLHENDPKAYWKLLEDLKSEDKSNAEPQILPDEWVDHFSSLNTLQEKFKPRVDQISDLLTHEEKLKTFSNLDFQISPQELQAAVVCLKNNKAVGLDSISNEMLKCGFSHLKNCLLKLFNSILTNGSYPSQWKKAYLSPIHKGGTSDNPNNYRGISILSCAAKLFNVILTKRLDNFLQDNSLINPVQIGFTKKARTDDHMFVLRTLIEKYTKDKSGKLFACFIDFRKAFDTVIHDIMLYKLIKIGIAGNFYNVIKDMYVGSSKLTWTFLITYDYMTRFHSNF